MLCNMTVICFFGKIHLVRGTSVQFLFLLGFVLFVFFILVEGGLEERVRKTFKYNKR